MRRRTSEDLEEFNRLKPELNRFQQNLNPDIALKEEIRLSQFTFEDPWPMSRKWKILILYNTILSVLNWAFFYVLLTAFGVIPV